MEQFIPIVFLYHALCLKSPRLCRLSAAREKITLKGRTGIHNLFQRALLRQLVEINEEKSLCVLRFTMRKLVVFHSQLFLLSRSGYDTVLFLSPLLFISSQVVVGGGGGGKVG